MENLIWVIYFIDVICGDWAGLGMLLVMLLILSIHGLIFKVFTSSCENDSDAEFLCNVLKKVPLKTIMITSFTILFLSNFIPSKDTAYKMLAAYGAVEVIQNEDVQEVFGDGMDILKQALKDYKQEMVDKK